MAGSNGEYNTAPAARQQGTKWHGFNFLCLGTSGSSGSAVAQLYPMGGFMRNGKYIRKYKVCRGYGECSETTWAEPGFKEHTCPCCKGTGRASAKKVQRFEAQCKKNDKAEALWCQ